MSRPQQPPLFYTVAEAAALLRVSRDTVYRQIRLGRLAAVRLGARRVVPADAIRQLITDVVVGPPDDGHRGSSGP